MKNWRVKVGGLRRKGTPQLQAPSEVRLKSTVEEWYTYIYI